MILYSLFVSLFISLLFIFIFLKNESPSDNPLATDAVKPVPDTPFLSFPIKDDQNQALLSKTWNGFDVEVLVCSKMSAKITCKMRNTSTKKDAKLNIHRETTLFDNNGNQANIRTLQYGSHSPTTMKSYTHHLYKEFIAGVAVEAILSFNLADSKASGLSAFKLMLSTSKRAKHKEMLVFRDIAL
jgi:hypothetical protein